MKAENLIMKDFVPVEKSALREQVSVDNSS